MRVIQTSQVGLSDRPQPDALTREHGHAACSTAPAHRRTARTTPRGDQTEPVARARSSGEHADHHRCVGRPTYVCRMAGGLPEVVLITTASVDGRVTLEVHQRLIDPVVRERWKSIQVGGARRRHPILHVLVCRAIPAGYLQRLRDLGVGYFVTGDRRVDLRLALAANAKSWRRTESSSTPGAPSMPPFCDSALSTSSTS